MILIVGASGRLGRAVTQVLLTQGKPVRLMTRNPASLADFERQGAEIVSGDLRDPRSLESACRGVDQILAAAHALNGKNGNNPHTVDDQGNRRLIDIAKSNRASRFIFISIRRAAPDSPLSLFRIKYMMEEYLRASGLNYTILRPAAFMDLWGELLGAPILQQGNATIFGRGDNPINFVAVEDLAHLIATALDDPNASNQTIEVCGPENLTMNQVAQIFEGLKGLPAKKRHIPLPMMRFASTIMPYINPMMGRLIQNGVFMDTADLTCETNGSRNEFHPASIRFQNWARDHYGNSSKGWSP